MSAPEAPALRGIADLERLVERRTGLDITCFEPRRMVRALDQVKATIGARSGDDVRRLVESDEDAFRELVDRLTVGETYFFRERRQLGTLRHLVLPALASDPSALVHAWSAGCASGEEAYTLAIMFSAFGLRGRAEVLGTDLSGTALERAVSAVYGAWSLRALDDGERKRYFERTRARRFRLRERFRRGVKFRIHNLLEEPPGRFELVLCRNVLIYLSPDAIEKATCALRDALVPGGWLVTGAADPLLEVAGLERVPEAGCMLYRKSGPARNTLVRPNAEAVSGDARPTASLRLSASEVELSTGPPEERPVASREPVRAPAKPEAAVRDGTATPLSGRGRPSTVPPDACVVMSLIDEGRTAEAVNHLDQALADRPLDAQLRYLAAVLHLDGGQVEQAISEVRAALYLSPDLAVAHLLLGAIQASRGQEREALRCFGNAAELLRGLPPDAAVPLAEEPAGQLVSAAQARAGRSTV